MFDMFIYWHVSIKNFFVIDWYMTFIKNDLPRQASTVKKICNGSTTVNGENDLHLR